MFILQITFSSNPKRVKTTIGNPSEGKKRKKHFYSNYFLTKDNEARFALVMQRKFMPERKVILKPGEVNELQLELNEGRSPPFELPPISAM